MNRILLSKNQIENIIKNFDWRDKIDFGGKPSQSFEYESVWTNNHTYKDIDMCVVVDVEEHTNKVTDISFNLLGFELGGAGLIDVDCFNADYYELIEKLQEELIREINNN